MVGSSLPVRTGRSLAGVTIDAQQLRRISVFGVVVGLRLVVSERIIRRADYGSLSIEVHSAVINRIKNCRGHRWGHASGLVLGTVQSLIR